MPERTSFPELDPFSPKHGPFFYIHFPVDFSLNGLGHECPPCPPATNSPRPCATLVGAGPVVGFPPLPPPTTRRSAADCCPWHRRCTTCGPTTGCASPAATGRRGARSVPLLKDSVDASPKGVRKKRKRAGPHRWAGGPGAGFPPAQNGRPLG